MSIYEILPALDLTQSVHAKISIGMHRGVKFKISRIPLIGLETRLGWRTDSKFLQNPNLNEIRSRRDCQNLFELSIISLRLGFRRNFLSVLHPSPSLGRLGFRRNFLSVHPTENFFGILISTRLSYRKFEPQRSR
jgi:hypothetical protein